MSDLLTISKTEVKKKEREESNSFPADGIRMSDGRVDCETRLWKTTLSRVNQGDISADWLSRGGQQSNKTTEGQYIYVA